MQSLRIGERGQVLVVSLVLVGMIRLALQHYIVDQYSMEPTLQSGQYILVNRLAYARILLDLPGMLLQATSTRDVHEDALEPFGAPQRGDIIVFQAGPDHTLVKRVIGLPGEEVAIQQQTVYIDGKPLDEPYIDQHFLPNYTMPAMLVGPDEYFVLGDNRNASYDSHRFGTIPREWIIGRAILCYWPLDRSTILAPEK